MPIFTFTSDSPQEKKRRELIERILPKESIVHSFLQPRLMEAMNDVLIKALKKEIEIYRAFPKKGKYSLSNFDPRTTDKCFMGQGFQANGKGLEGWYDGELAEYRKAVGCMSHVEWGNSTLLEIWGGDHFKNYPDMVKGVMMYAWGDRKTMPEIEFHINPFFKNDKSGKMILSASMKEDKISAAHMTKLAHYIEIRDRLKKENVKNLLDLDPEEDVE